MAGTILSSMLLAVSSPRISTGCLTSLSARAGRSFSAIFLCTTRDSAALHTPILCVFAFSIMSIAMSISADSSTNMWQFPVPVSITGTVAFLTTKLISLPLPLGIIRSI